LWPPNWAGIIFCYCGFFFFLLFFPHLISVVTDWMSTILPHMMWLSAHLERRSEMSCMQLAENTRCQKIAICTPWHKFVGLHLRNQGMYRQSGKKLVKQLLSSMCPHSMVNFGPLTAESGWRVWGTPANFSGFCILASLLHRCRSSEVNQTLHDVWPSPGLVHYTVSQKKRPTFDLL